MVKERQINMRKSGLKEKGFVGWLFVFCGWGGGQG